VLDELPVGLGSPGRQGGEPQHVRGGIIRGLRLRHVLEPRAGRIGVDKAGARGVDQDATGTRLVAVRPGEDPDRGHLADLGRDVDGRRPAFLGGLAGFNDCGVLIKHRLVLLQRLGVRIELLVQLLRQVTQRSEGTRHHDEPPVIPHQRPESLDHPVGAVIVGVDEFRHALRVGPVRGAPRGGVREHDVDPAVPLAQQLRARGDLLGIRHIED
jgi:hypothetical protein